MLKECDNDTLYLQELIGKEATGPEVQSAVSPTADPGGLSSIPAQPHTFVEIDHGIISTVADSRRAVVSYKQKYVH